MQYNYFLWDLDGTLTDPKEGITKSVQYAMAKLGRSYPSADELEWVIGPPLSHSFKLLLGTDDENLVHKAIQLYRERYSVQGMYENLVYPGIKELLAQITEQGGQNIVATSKPRVFAEEILSYFALRPYFSLVIGSELDGRLDSKTEIIQEALGRLAGIPHQRVVMIGDRLYDIIGARENAIDAIAVTYGYGTIKELSEAGPAYLVNSPQELGLLLEIL